MAYAPKRLVRLMRSPDANGIGVLALFAGKKTHFYAFKEIRSQIGGRAFALHRMDADEVYHVRIGQPQQCSCECMGYLRHGNCKHLKGLLALTGQGSI